jgi:PAS domain S-box-containing protein
VARLSARLAEAERRLREIVEGSLVSIFIHWDNRLLFANETFARTFGYDSVDEVLAIGNWLQFLAPQERLRMESYRQARAGGRTAPVRYYFQGLRKDGSLIWLENVVRMVTWEGQPAILSMMLDVTERVRIEEELRRSEERFRVAFEHAPIGMSLIDAGRGGQGGVQVNRAFAEVVGHPREALMTMANYDAVIQAVTHPGDVEATRAGFGGLIAGELESFQQEKRYLRPDGTIRWGVLNSTLVRTPDGAPDYLINQVVDITERKQAELALRESEERFRAAFEHTPVGLAMWEFGTGGVQANSALCQFLDRSTEWFQANRDRVALIREVVAPDRSEESLELFEQVRRGEIDSFQIVARFVRPSGAIRWGNMNLTVTRGEDALVRYVLVQITDITPWKEAEAALLASEERFRVAFEHAPLAIAVAEPGKGWVQVNPAMEQFLGRPREQLLGRPDVLDLVRAISHPDDCEAILGAIAQMVAGEIDSYSTEKRYVRPSGEVRWGFLSVAASRRPDGTLHYAVSQVADIAALKRAEQALREREAGLAAAQRLAHLGNWEVENLGGFNGPPDLNRAQVLWSDEVYRIFGYAPRAVRVTGELFLAGVHPNDRARVEQAIFQALEHRAQFDIEHRVVRADGTERAVRHLSDIVYDSQSPRVLHVRGIVQDITEQKELEGKLLQSQKLESLGLLAGGIAHDFNNLLTGILGYASLAQQGSAGVPNLGEYLSQIEAGGRRAAELCQQMLAYAGRGRFDVRPFDINAIVRDTLPLLEVSIPKKVTLILHLAEGLPPVQVDGSQIRQIVMNLVTNAADAIGNAEGRIAVTSGVMQADRDYLVQTYLAPDLPEGPYVYLEVSDTGMGMTAEVQRKIFDPFFTTKFAGRGLGLAAVLGIVRAHRGALKVYSEPGRGSTLRLLLPVASGAQILPDPGTPRADWRGEGLALVIDDEPTVREVAQRMLQTLGFTVVAAADGKEGLSLYRAQTRPVRLVLLDLTMPQLDGEEAFRALREFDPSATVVLMSGFTEQEALDRFAGTGLAAFLQKPFSLDSLRETLEHVLAAPGAAGV